jgi:enoyl-CoA hydratase
MSEPVVLVTKEGGVATVTLNRPEKLNALNRELRQAFCRTMQELRDDPEAQVVIITGAGRAFCAGLDLRELGEDAKTESGALVRDGSNVSFISVIEDMQVN